MARKIVLFFILLAFLIGGSATLLYVYVRKSNAKVNLRLASFSVENSYVFVSPLQAKADGVEKIKVTVFLIDNKGLGVKGKKVVLDFQPGLLIEAVQDITDDYGKAIFYVSSQKEGDFYLKVYIEGRSLKQSAHLRFDL